jgi:hypothetical protein
MLSILDSIYSMISAHNWLGVTILVLGLVQAWLGPGSSFPITLSNAWRIVVTTALGQAYAILLIVQAGQPWQQALVYGLVATVLALLTSHAIWNGNAPSWAQTLAFILQEVSAKTESKTSAPVPPTKPLC